MLLMLSIIAALLIGWAAVTVALRWSPLALGFLPHIVVASAAFYIVLAMTYSSVHDAEARSVMLTMVHTCFAVSSVTWWWLTLRITAAHGRPLNLPVWLSHVVPVITAGLPLVLGFAGVNGAFLTYAEQDQYTFHIGWYLLIGTLLTLSLATIVLGMHRALTSDVREDRVQFFCVAAVTLSPSVLGAIAAANSGPIELMSLGYGISCAIVIRAIYTGQMYPGLGMSLDTVWATDPNACMVLDRYNRLIYANAAANVLLPSTQLRGIDVGTWLPEQVTARNGETVDVDSLLSGDSKSRASVRLLRLEGDTERLYSCEVRPMMSRGRDVGSVLTLRDETVHEKFREAALAARRIESLSHMAGGVAHRFNNLLVSVVGNVDIAKYEIESEELNHQAVQEILHDIQAAGQQAAELAKQLVTFTGNQLGHVEVLDLNLVTHEALALLGKRLPPRVRCDVALAASRLLVRADRSQIIELVLNLVTNAQEAYGDTGGSIRVTTGFRQVGETDLSGVYNRAGMAIGDYAFIEVSDHGPGLSQEVSDRLFDPFVTTKSEAQGLGLATVLGTAIAHQGGVEVRSDARGSCFTVYIPQVPAAESVEPNHISVEPVSRETCLVVDDHPEVLNVHRAMLESLGQQAVATTSPTQALEMARMYRFELALVDVSMPEMRGDELIQHIREVDPDLPVILVSGYAEEQSEAERLSGRTVFLEKPFGLTELHDAILKVTKARESADSTAEVVSLSSVRPTPE